MTLYIISNIIVFSDSNANFDRNTKFKINQSVLNDRARFQNFDPTLSVGKYEKTVNTLA